MGKKLTLAEWKRRAPNLPEAELKRKLQAIRRLEKQFAQATRNRAPLEPRAFDPQKLNQEELALLRQEFEDGDPLSLNEAFLMCGKSMPAWVRDGLTRRLEEELWEESKKSKKKPRRKYREFARWATIDYYRRRGATYPEALRLTAEAYGMSESQIEKDWKAIRQKRDLPERDYEQPGPKGLDDDPRDLIGGPDRLPPLKR